MRRQKSYVEYLRTRKTQQLKQSIQKWAKDMNYFTKEDILLIALAEKRIEDIQYHLLLGK